MTANIDLALQYQITQDSGVQAVITNQFFPIIPQQNAVFPLAVYQFISSSLIGIFNETSQLPSARIQITCFGMIQDDVINADHAIKSVLDGQKGVWGTSDYQTTIEESRAISTPRDVREPVSGMYQRSRDYFIMWYE